MHLFNKLMPLYILYVCSNLCGCVTLGATNPDHKDFAVFASIGGFGVILGIYLLKKGIDLKSKVEEENFNGHYSYGQMLNTRMKSYKGNLILLVGVVVLLLS